LEEKVRQDYYRPEGPTCRDRGRFVAGSEAERFLARIEVVGGCWLWTGGLTSDGYPRFTTRSGRDVRAHRWAWEWLEGPIPEGRTLDHLIGPEEPCTSRRCVRTGHLEPVTNAENVRRRHARRRLNGVT
jgi:hypothetical protein